MATIAPWINVNPSDFVHAAEAGARIGTERRGQDIAAGEAGAGLAERASEASQRFQLAQQGLAEHQHQNQVASELKRQQMMQNAQLQTTREAVANSYKQQTLELAKQRITDVHEKYLKHLSDQRLYQIGLQNGMKPKDLAVQFPDAFDSGMWSSVLRPEKPASTAPSLVDKKNLDSLYDTYNEANKKVLALSDSEENQAEKSRLKNEAAKAMIKIRDLSSKFSAPEQPEQGGQPQPAPSQQAGQQPAPDADSGAQTGLPKAGDVFNGYKFKGGDPATQSNWEEINPEAQ